MSNRDPNAGLTPDDVLAVVSAAAKHWSKAPFPSDASLVKAKNALIIGLRQVDRSLTVGDVLHALGSW